MYPDIITTRTRDRWLSQAESGRQLDMQWDTVRADLLSQAAQSRQAYSGSSGQSYGFGGGGGGGEACLRGWGFRGQRCIISAWETVQAHQRLLEHQLKPSTCPMVQGWGTKPWYSHQLGVWCGATWALMDLASCVRGLWSQPRGLAAAGQECGAVLLSRLSGVSPVAQCACMVPEQVPADMQVNQPNVVHAFSAAG